MITTIIKNQIRVVVNQSRISVKLLLTGAILLILTGCKKFVQVEAPSTAISSATAYNNDLSAASAMTSIYINMMSTNGNLSGGETGIACLTGLAADELKSYSSNNSMVSEAYSNSLNSSNTFYWTELFARLYDTNAVLEGLQKSSGVSAAEKQQLMGEAKFMRAFLNFYGTNLFGDFPLVTSTNYLVNNTIKRSSQTDVYQQIIADLKDAQNLLPANFVGPTGGASTTERVRPNQGAATALLARVYLYNGQWANAETSASAVIGSGLYSLVNNLDSAFLANNTEAIWQMRPVYPGYNTWDALKFVVTAPPSNNGTPVTMSSNLYNAFEVNDNRLSHWIGVYVSGTQTYYYPFKYKMYKFNTSAPVTEYLMVLRFAEQYLIRAEARAQQGKLQDAEADLNVIRNRAGLPNTMASTQTDLLTAIYHERQVEMFTEWGHRWFDLKRTGLINSVMGSPGNVTSAKGGTWKPDWALFPIPKSEITLNPNLIQNTGY